MPYTVTRQIQWPDGTNMVEVSVGGLDYTNPDALSPKYPGEFETYDDPREAVKCAIAICETWRQDGAPEAQVGIGATLGMTMPFEPATYEEARVWADRVVERLSKCDYCGELLPKQCHIHPEMDDNDQRFCSEYCAEEAYEDMLAHEPVQYQVCDSCLTVAYDKGIRGPARQAMLMAFLGGEEEDHECDAMYEPGTQCECGCRKR